MTGEEEKRRTPGLRWLATTVATIVLLTIPAIAQQLIPLGERHREHREAVAHELVKPQIDRAALERLREQGMGLADEASRIVVDGVADLAEVLSPEQRAELLELMHRFHHGGSPPIG